jgi:ubiquinone/menaquinone biosynthesis C-methylase UbiE
MMSEDKRLRSERAFDDMIADDAEKIWHWQGCAGKIRWQRRAGLIFDRLRQSAPGTILEIGSGTGILTQELVNRLNNRGTYVSSDISLSLLNRAKKKEYGAGKKLSFLINNAYCNGIGNNSIDAVVGISVLHHLDIPEALQEFYRILKPNGIGVFTEPNYINPHIFLERKVGYLRKKLRVSEYETAFVRWKLQKKLMHAGFKNIEIFPFDFVYPFMKSERLIDLMCSLGNFLERAFFFKEFAGSLFITFQK